MFYVYWGTCPTKGTVRNTPLLDALTQKHYCTMEKHVSSFRKNTLKIQTCSITRNVSKMQLYTFAVQYTTNTLLVKVPAKHNIAAYLVSVCILSVPKLTNLKKILCVRDNGVVIEIFCFFVSAYIWRLIPTLLA